MAQLNYAVDTDIKRLRIYFDTKNPVEYAILKQALVQFKMYGYKVPATDLICIELSIDEQLAKAYIKYSEDIAQAEIKQLLVEEEKRDSKSLRREEQKRKKKIIPQIKNNFVSI
jgi:hypothetical protein